MNFDYVMIFSQYQERVKRMALHEPLIQLERKQLKDLSGERINMYDMGLVTLLFFFECKLTRIQETGIEELARFIMHVTQNQYTMDDKLALRIANDVIQAFRPSSGKRLAKVFHNYETGVTETIYYSILKASKSDLQTNRQYYELDEDGLELVFSTKEYFSEYQISISQMLLRKQLEKGEYNGALRQIEEMQMNVNTLQDRIGRLKREVIRNITSEEVSKRYKRLIEDIHHRLERENEEFNLLAQFVKDTLVTLAGTLKEDKDFDIYNSALRVEKALNKVHRLHHRLFNESIELKRSVLIAAREALYHVGLQTFNFNKEIVGSMLSRPFPVEAAKQLMAPFLRLEKAEVWSPTAVFFPQRIVNREGQTNPAYFFEITQNEVIENSQRAKIFQIITEHLITSLGHETTIDLSDYIALIRETDQHAWLETRTFYDYWMVLHQLSPIRFESITGESHKDLIQVIVDVCKTRFTALQVKEKSEIITPNARFAIKDMTIQLEVKYEL